MSDSIWNPHRLRELLPGIGLLILGALSSCDFGRQPPPVAPPAPVAAPQTVTAPPAPVAPVTDSPGAPAEPPPVVPPEPVAVPASPPAPTVGSQASGEVVDGEVVFNPRKPPPGYKNCHRDHCHRVEDDSVVSYAEVMAEIGATRMVGQPDMSKMPPPPDDVAQAPDDAIVTESGLAMKVLRKGTGQVRPGPESILTFNYSAWTADGTGLESTDTVDEPARMPLSLVRVPGWKEGLEHMVVGEERRFWIPESIAFNGAPGLPAGMLVFDVELLDIEEP